MINEFETIVFDKNNELVDSVFVNNLKIRSPYLRIDDKYENILKFIEDIDDFQDCNIVLDGSLTVYSTEANYRLVISEVVKTGKGLLVVSEPIKSPRLIFVFRALRVLGLDNYFETEVLNNKCVFKINRGAVLYLKKTQWFKNPAPYCFDISEADAIKKITEAVKSGNPFSLIRVGHCEVRFLGQDLYYGLTDIQKSAQMQWGGAIDEEKVKWVKGNLRKSVQEADILGFKNRGDFSSRGLKILENSVLNCLASLSLLKPGQCKTTPNIHFKIATDLGFLDALQKAKKIVLVTPRKELKDIFESIFNEIPIDLISLDGEFRIDGGGGDIDNRFRRFFEIEDEIDEIAGPGVVFLIGVGVAGKQYCSIAKSKGGIGIDMGSVLDAWAGIDSRGSGFDSSLKNSLITYKNGLGD